MSKFLLPICKFTKAFLRKLQEDHITAYSAMSAYFLLMSFIPFLMILLMLAKYLPFSENDILGILNSFSIIQENAFLRTVILAVFEQTNGAILGLTLFFLLWSASKSIWGFMKGLNSVYDIKEARGGLLVRFLAVFYTVAFLFILIVALIFLVFGNTIYQQLLKYNPIFASIAGILFGLRSFFSVFILTGFFLLLYMHLPTGKTSVKSQFPGAVFSSLGWTIYSFFFSLYVSHFSGHARLYGGLGTVLVFFLWLYMLMYILFLGAEVNYFLSEEGRRYFSSQYY